MIVSILIQVLCIVSLIFGIYKIYKLTDVVVLDREDMQLSPTINGRDVCYWFEEAKRLGHKEAWEEQE